jgi:hypothetical protein
VLVSGGSAQAVPPALSYGCVPAALAGSVAPAQGACDGWQTQPVELMWSWNASIANAVLGECPNPQVFGDDSVSQAASCTIQETAGTDQTAQTIHLKIDTAPPTVSAAVPDRPADSNGWWTHPVGYTFTATDASSQVQFCAPVLFSGPGTRVVGTCTDNAGNVGTATFSVPYDATPPAAPKVKALAGNGSETIAWQPSDDTVRSQVVRSPGPGSAASTMVYNGSGTRFVDSSLTNGTTYDYTVTVYDQAGNDSSASAKATPDASIGLGPARGSQLGPKRVLRWPSVAGASYYNVQLFRGNKKVFTTWPKRRVLKVPRHWTFKGRHYSLRPGSYRWYVWPGFGKLNQHKFGKLIGQSSFRVAGA